MELKNSEIIVLEQALKGLKVEGSTPKEFRFYKSCTLRKLTERADAIRKKGAIANEFLDEQVARNEALRKNAFSHCENDEKGNAIVKNGGVKIPDDKKADFDNGVENIKEDFAQLIDAEEAQHKTLEAYLDKTCEIAISPLSLAVVPDAFETDEEANVFFRYLVVESETGAE